jgi:GT2 family glycosyltransferase
MTPQEGANPTSVTVVIPTFRRPLVMAECIRSLLDGAELPREIIVVGRQGDTATEEAIAKIEGLCREKTSFQAVWVTERGHLPPIEKGLRMASTDIVAFVDDDVTVTKEWLGHLRAPFTDPTLGVLGGQVITPSSPPAVLKGRPGCVSWYGKHWGNVSSRKDGTPVEVQGVTECNWAWRRSVLASLKFDPVLNFGDACMYGLDLCLQAREKGSRVVYDSRALVYHHPAPRSPDLNRDDRPHRIYGYTRNYTYIMLKHLPWWRWPFFMSWWFLVGERSGWGVAAVLADALRGRLPPFRDVWSALRGKIEGILTSTSGLRARG